MKHSSLLVLIVTALFIFSGTSIAQTDRDNALFSIKVAKSGCCKARKSAKHPWVKVNKGFEKCKKSNSDDGDKIYKSKGLYWWDRSC